MHCKEEEDKVNWEQNRRSQMRKRSFVSMSSGRQAMLGHSSYRLVRKQIMLAKEKGEMRAPPILCKRLKLCFQDENITIQHTYFLKKISAHLHCNRNYLWFSAFILVQIVCR